MANPTTNYGWTLPVDLASNGAWGAILNTAMQAVDTALFTVSGVANAALARTGGAMTGRVDMKGVTMARVDKGSISGAQSLDLSTGQYFTLTVGGALTLSVANVPAGSWATGVILKITNGGAFAITWPTGSKWPSGSVPTLTVSGVDMVSLQTDDNGTTWRGALIAKDLR